MYLSVQKLLLLGATLVAAAPTTNNVTSEAIATMEIGIPALQLISDLLVGMNNDTHFTVYKGSDGFAEVRGGKGRPSSDNSGPPTIRLPLPGHVVEDGPRVAGEEAEEPSETGMEKAIRQVADKLEPGNHAVVLRHRLPSKGFSYRLNQGTPTLLCYMGGLGKEAAEEPKDEELVTRDTQQSECKWKCFKKWGPILGKKCRKKCKD